MTIQYPQEWNGHSKRTCRHEGKERACFALQNSPNGLKLQRFSATGYPLFKTRRMQLLWVWLGVTILSLCLPKMLFAQENSPAAATQTPHRPADTARLF